MGILAWIILGLVAGWLASIVMGTNSQQGPLMDIVLGVVGAIVGGYIISLFGEPSISGLNLYSIFVAVLGSVTVIWLGRTLSSHV